MKLKMMLRCCRAGSLQPGSGGQLHLQRVTAGEYALQVVHDLNSNHEFDYNVFTGPSEPFGVSRIRWAEADNLPDWQQVKFTLNEPVFTAKPVTMTVTLNE